MIKHKDILKNKRKIAIIGLSDKKQRASYQVAEYLQKEGFEIIPINPNIKEVFGIKSYKSFSDIPKNIKIEIVDIFRKKEEVVEIVNEIIRSKRKVVIWLQEGSENDRAEKLAREKGLEIVSGLCLMKSWQKEKV